MPKVRIADIVFERLIYPRVLTDDKPFWASTARFAQKMRAGEQFPPITLSKIKGKNILIDGWHRMEATRLNDKDTIEANFIKCQNYSEAFVASVQANNRHGTPLTPYEIRLASQKLHEEYKFSQADIASILSIPPLELQKIMMEGMIRTANGTVVLKRMFIGKPVPKNITQEMQSLYSSRSQIELLKQVNALIDDDLVDIDNEEVRSELEKLFKGLRRIGMR